MATNIEQRVVQMRFDNAQFEKGISQSYNSLDRFEKKLNFKGATKGLENVQAVANQVSLAHLAQEADGVRVKIDAMAVATITALQRMMNAAITAGKNLAKALTIDPIASGLEEYELKLNSIQTILANTKRHGSTIDDVSAALNELNHYADKTIYNFGQMTQAIGMFTTAGIDLETSTNAVKGISNLAAFVGAPASDASRAMYQLSQGLATGYINLRDWMSLENTAGMSGIEFQNRLKDTARILGKNVDAMIAKNGSFRESLKEGWLSTEVLTETLKQFAGEVDETYLRQQGWTEAQISSIMELGRTATESATVVKTFKQLVETLKESAQSGWAESWEIIIGGLDEAKKLWTNVNNVIGGIIEGQAAERNEMLRTWAGLGGRSAILNTIGRAFQNLLNIVNAFKSAIDDIFPPMTGERLFRLTMALKEFVYSLTPSEEAVNTLRIAFKALLLPIKAVISILEIAGVAIVRFVQIGFKMVDKILAWPSKFATVEDALSSVFGNERAHRMAEALSKIIDNIGNALFLAATSAMKFIGSLFGTNLSNGVSIFQRLRDILEPIGGWIIDRIVDGLDAIANADYSIITNGLKGIWDMLGNLSSKLDFTGVTNFFKSVWSMLNEVGTTIMDIDLSSMFEKPIAVGKRFLDVVMSIVNAMIEFTNKLSPTKILVFSFGASMVWLFVSLASTIGSFKEVVEASAGVLKGVTNVLGGTTNVLNAFAERIKPSHIKEIVIAIVALTAALVILSNLDTPKLLAAAGALAGVMAALLAFTAGIAVINKALVASPEMAKNIQKISVSMLAMSASVAMLAGALALLSAVDLEGIGYKMLSLGLMLAAMVGAAVLVGKFAKDIEKTSVYVLSFSASILLLAFAMNRIADLDLSGAAPNILILAAAMGLFSLVSKSTQKVKFTSMAGLTLFVLDIVVFAGVLSLMAKLDASNLIAGIINMMPIFIALATLAGVIRISGGRSAKMGGQLLLISASIIILGLAIQQIGSLDSGVVAKGIGVVSLLLTLFGGIIVLSQLSDRNMGKVGASFIGMATAILILGLAIKYIGQLDLPTILKGSITVGALLTLFGIINAVGNAANGAKSSIIAMSVCLGLLTASLAILTLLDFNELMGSALALGLVMGAMGLMLKGAKDLKVSSAMGAILELIAVVSMLGLMFKYLDGVDPKSTLSSAIGVGIVLAALNLSFGNVHIRRGDTGNLYKTIISMITLLAGVSLVFGLLSRFGSGQAPIQNAAAIGIVLSTLTASFGLVKVRTDSSTDLAKTVASMIGMLAGIATVFGILQRFGNAEQPIQNATAIGLILMALSASMRIMNGVSAPSDLITTLGTMAGMLTMATIVVAILNAMPINDGLIEKTVAMSTLLVALSAAIAILSKVGVGLSMLGTVAGPAIAGVGTALLMVAMISAFILAVGAAFEHFDALEPALAKAEEIFPRIGLVIGSFIGNIIGGFLGGTVGGAIEQFGTSLSNFAQNVEGFLALKVDQDTVDAIGRLALVAAMISGVEFLDAINIFSSGNSLEKFGLQLAAFGPHFAQFADDLAEVPVAELTAASGAMEALAGVLANIPTEGGLMGMIVGGKSLEGFSKGLNELAGGIGAYATSLSESDVSDETIEKTNQVAKSLATLANSVPKTGGLVSFLGEHNIGIFGEQLRTFSQALIDVFADFASANIDEDVTKTVTTCGQMLVGLANDVPKTGALVSFLGGHDIGAFGTQLVEYATGLKNFFAELSGVTIDENVAKAASAAGLIMVDLADSVPKTGKLISFLGGKDIGKFGEQIGGYGAGIASFFTAITAVGLDEGKIDLSKSAGMAFVEIAEAIGTNAGLSTILEKTDLGEFGKQIQKLGGALAGYYEQVDSVEWGTVSTSIDQLKRIAELAPVFAGIDHTTASEFKAFMINLATTGISDFTMTFGDAEEEMSSTIYSSINSALQTAKTNMVENPMNYGFIVDSIIAGMDAKKDSLIQKAKDLIQTIKSSVEAQATTIEQIGTFIMDGITESFESGVEKLKDAVKRVVDGALSEAKRVLDIQGTHSKQFHNIGQYCVNGFINGIYNNQQRLYNKVSELGNTVVQKFSDSVGVASPSKKFSEIGMYSILGYAEGIKTNTHLGETAMIKMGANLLQSIKNFFEIRSPSRVTRDEVGRYIVEGIADGITSNMSAEEAAQKKAANIVNAFKDEFDRLSADLKTSELEYKLWSAMNPNASANQSDAMYSDLLNKRLEVQAQRVAAAEAQYQATLKTLGESSAETRDAYNTYLEEKITMADLATEMSDIRQSNTDAFLQFSQKMGAMYDDLRSMGFADEEIREWAKAESGWKEGMVGDTLPSGGVESIMQSYMEQAQVGANGVEVVIVEGTQKAVASAVSTARTGGTQAGTAYSESAGQSIEQQLPTKVQNVWSNLTDNTSSDGSKAGISAVEGYINGGNSKIDDLKNAAMNWINESTNSVRTALDSHSPSRVYQGIGVDAINGLIIGLNELSPQAVEINRSLGMQMLDTMRQYEPQYQNVGAQMMIGFANGISSGGSSVINAAISVAQQAIAATNQMLGIHSPSREYYRIGQMIDQGLANGITDNYGIVEGSLLKMVDDMTDVDYTVRPIVDASSLENANKEADKFKDALGYIDDAEDEEARKRRELTKAYNQILRFDANGNVIPWGIESSSGKDAADRWIKLDSEYMSTLKDLIYGEGYKESGGYKMNELNELLGDLFDKANVGKISQNDPSAWKDAPTYSFTQNNYSPTALSTAEIARRSETGASKFANTVSNIRLDDQARSTGTKYVSTSYTGSTGGTNKVRA